MAFITQRGVELFQGLKPLDPRPDLRLVASVRWPSDLDALQKLAADWPGSVWLHLCGNSPRERAGDRFQMHSKIVYVEHPGQPVDAFIGSHNLTAAALDGINDEASVHLRCHPKNAVAQQIREHIDCCRNEAEQFDPFRMPLYRQAQIAFQNGLRSYGDGVEGFKSLPVMVIYAEATDSKLLTEPVLRLFTSVGHKGAAERFINGRNVDLYLYPKGTLHGQPSPTAVPMFFRGRITMVNDGDDAAVLQRAVNASLDDLKAPRVQPENKIPVGRRPGLQVVMRLDQRETRVPRTYVKDRPRYRNRITHEGADLRNAQQEHDIDLLAYFTEDSFVDESLVFLRPHRLEQVAEIPVPGRRHRGEDPLARLRDDPRIRREANDAIQRRLETRDERPRTNETEFCFDARYVYDELDEEP